MKRKPPHPARLSRSQASGWAVPFSPGLETAAWPDSFRSLHRETPGHWRGSQNQSPLPSEMNTIHQTEWWLLCPLMKGQNKRSGGVLESDTICCTCCEEQLIPRPYWDCNQELAFTEPPFPSGVHICCCSRCFVKLDLNLDFAKLI